MNEKEYHIERALLLIIKKMDDTFNYISKALSYENKQICLSYKDLRGQNLILCIDKLKGHEINHLYLVSNQLEDADLKYVLDNINLSLSDLILSSNYFNNNNSMQRLSNFLKISQLKVLFLNNCRLNDEGLVILIDGLRNCPSLEELFLVHNNITDTSVIKLSEILPNSNLNLLDLGCNQIGDLAVKRLAESLEQNTTLKFLALNDINITNSGVMFFIEMLKINYTIIRLFLNNINIKLTIKIDELLEANNNIKMIKAK